MVKVFIWYAKGLNVGHSSLEVTCPITYQNEYISWWPGDNNLLKKNAGQYSTFEQDKTAEGRSPDFEKEIERLDELKIIEWWRTFSNNSHSKYSLGKYNCSWAVIKGLKIGGADNYFPWHRFFDKKNIKIKLPDVKKVIWKYIDGMLDLHGKERITSTKLKLVRPLIDIIDEYSYTWSPNDVTTYVQLLELGMNNRDSLKVRIENIPFETFIKTLPKI